MSALGGKGLEGRSVKGLPSVSLQPDMFGFLHSCPVKYFLIRPVRLLEGFLWCCRITLLKECKYVVNFA